MSERIDAREFYDVARDAGAVIQVVKFEDEQPIGRGEAFVVNSEQQIALMLTDCGNPTRTRVPSGSLVSFVMAVEDEHDRFRVTGTAAGPTADRLNR